MWWFLFENCLVWCVGIIVLCGILFGFVVFVKVVVVWWLVWVVGRGFDCLKLLIGDFSNFDEGFGVVGLGI